MYVTFLSRFLDYQENNIFFFNLKEIRANTRPLLGKAVW